MMVIFLMTNWKVLLFLHHVVEVNKVCFSSSFNTLFFNTGHSHSILQQLEVIHFYCQLVIQCGSVKVQNILTYSRNKTAYLMAMELIIHNVNA